MKLPSFKLIPVFIIVCVLVVVCWLSALRPEFFERLEWMTYDWRARQALKFHPPASTNFGFVFMDEASIKAVQDKSVGFNYGLLWPRSVYGCVLQELAEQGAKIVAFDVLFGGLRPDHPPIQMANGQLVESDEFFGLALRRAGNGLIAVTPDVQPPALFATNTLALGEISTDKDPDGVLRRAKAFQLYSHWHPAFQQAAREFDLDLGVAKVETNRIVLFQSDGDKTNTIFVPLDAEGNFSLADFVGDKLPPGMPAKAKPFTEDRIWHMGIVLAAQELKLDLAKAEVDLKKGRIVLRNNDGSERVIPVDTDGFFYVDWCLKPDDPRITKESIQTLLLQNKMRREGNTDDLVNRWKDKIVVVGSAAQGNDLTDRGATPLRKDTLLVSKHWNVANSIITGRFIHRSSVLTEWGLITVLGLLSALVTWRMRVLLATTLVILFSGAYVAFAFSMYAHDRLWLPIFLPVIGALGITHVCLIIWLALFEQTERRRVRSVFSKIVSPNIVNVLLKTEKLALGGVQREITVYFADIRGFTKMTDDGYSRATEYIKANKLSDREVEDYLNEQARETLRTVNGYLAVIGDIVKKYDGTLDKYIGDCAMAFWGAPMENSRHAVTCVRAAIEAQRAMRELNQQRAAENQKIEEENKARIAAGQPSKPLLSLLMLGSGINTGMVTVGLMGSEASIANYTVFGREVNLASRLEGQSGRGHILIGETTFKHLKRDDPALAATCLELQPVTVKGVREPVKVYEVPWLPPGAKPLDEEFPVGHSETGFLPRH